MASQKISINNELKYFCAESSIHGLKYMFDFKLPRIIRATWFFVCVLSFIYSTYIVQKNIKGKFH